MGKRKSKRKVVRITQDMGNVLFTLSAGFKLPEKLGKETYERKYDTAQIGLAEKAVVFLHEELKRCSPRYHSENRTLFGPGDNWEHSTNDKGEKIDWELKDGKREVKMRIDKDIRQGAFWCLLMAVHPNGSMRLPPVRRADVVWPLVDRLRLRPELEKEMGIDKAKDRSIELTESFEFEEDDEGEEETEEVAEATVADEGEKKGEGEAGEKAESKEEVPV